MFIGMIYCSCSRPVVAHFASRLVGRAWQLCPGTSDVNFLCNLNCIIDLNAEIANSAFNFRMSE